MIEMGKKYWTRDGREVRIYAVDGEAPYRVHGAFVNSYGGWSSMHWTKSGKTSSGIEVDPLDLIEVRPEVTDRRYFVAHKGFPADRFLLETYSHDHHDCIGTIDITHDGEKLIRVEIVK